MKRVCDNFNHIMKIMRSNEAFGVSKRPVGCLHKLWQLPSRLTDGRGLKLK